MKIAISTIWNSDFKEIAEITIPVMEEYCRRHGYTLCAQASVQYPPDIVWSRLDMICPLLETHDYAVHMDADVLITNLSIRFEDIAVERGRNIATSENGIINDGVFIWGDKVWPRLLSSPEIRREHSSPQDAINSKYGSLMNIKHVEPRTMNSILNAEYGLENPLSEWQPGDFVVHLPGMGNARRVEVLKEMLSKIQR